MTVVDSVLERVAMPETALLAVLTVAGAAVYAACALVLVRSTTLELFTLGMGVIRPRGRPEPAVSAEATVNRW